MTVGTSAALRVVLPAAEMARARVPNGLWCYRIGKDRVLLGGALNDGGSMFQWAKDTLQLSTAGKRFVVIYQIKRLLQAIARIPMLSFYFQT